MSMTIFMPGQAERRFPPLARRHTTAFAKAVSSPKAYQWNGRQSPHLVEPASCPYLEAGTFSPETVVSPSCHRHVAPAGARGRAKRLTGAGVDLRRTSYRVADTPPPCRERWSAPDAGNSVLVKYRVCTYQGNALHQALGHQQSVKRVSVVEREGHLAVGMFQRDGQEREAEIRGCPLHPLAIRQGKPEFAEACFDGEFPDGADAHEQLWAGSSKTPVARFPSLRGSSNAQIKEWASRRCFTPCTP